MEGVGDISRVCNLACHLDEGIEYHEKLLVEYYVHIIVSINHSTKNRVKRTILYFGHLDEGGHVDGIPMKETSRPLGSPI